MRSQTNNRLEDFFSTNIDSVQKDVECVFGILKSHWSSLDKGFKYCQMKVCQEIFPFLRCPTHHDVE